jgi:hypothetical protein
MVSIKLTPWLRAASELYRPSDRRLSAKLVPTFADRGVSNGQCYNCYNSGYYKSSCLLFKTLRFRDSILSPSSGGTYIWVQSTELVPLSGPAAGGRYHMKTEKIQSSKRCVLSN